MAADISPVASIPALFPVPNPARNLDAGNSLLLQLNPASPQQPSTFAIADTIDLSPQAQSFIDFFDLVSDVNSNSAGSGLNSGGFILNDAQQATFDAIIASYKDAPFNADTYAQILSDLEAAGLSPAQLALRNASSSGLSSLLLGILNGQYSTADFFNFFNSPTTSGLNAAYYNQQVISAWEGVSTQYPTSLFNA